jgi:hypothetical protein
LEKQLKHIDYLSHPEAMKAVHAAQVLLLMINNSENSKGILTGKFFEYLASGRPILLVGPEDGDAADILNETRAGKAAGFDDSSAIRHIILEYYGKYKKDLLEVSSKGTGNYSRKRLTARLAVQLNELTDQDAELQV